MIEYHQVQETDQETEVGQLFRVFDTEGTGLIGSMLITFMILMDSKVYENYFGN